MQCFQEYKEYIPFILIKSRSKEIELSNAKEIEHSKVIYIYLGLWKLLSIS